MPYKKKVHVESSDDVQNDPIIEPAQDSNESTAPLTDTVQAVDSLVGSSDQNSEPQAQEEPMDNPASVPVQPEPNVQNNPVQSTDQRPVSNNFSY